MWRRVTLVLLAAALGGCSQLPGRVAAEGGPVPTTAPAPTAPPSDQPTAPPPPSAAPSPAPTPESSPSPTPSPSPSLPPPDLVADPDDGGFELRILGIVDPARADAVNVFAARPVVVLLHATDAAAATVADVTVRLGTDDGAVAEPAAGTTFECPGAVVDTVVLQPGQGQRLCANFDLPGSVAVREVTVAVGAAQATRDAVEIPVVDVDVAPGLGVGGPQDAVPLGEAVDVALPGPGGDRATVSLSVDAARPVEAPDVPPERALVAVEVTVEGDLDATVDVPASALAAITVDGTQWVSPSGARTGECRGLAVVPPADEPLARCVLFVVREGDVVSHVRFVDLDDAVAVWQVLEQGGVAGPGSNA